MAMSSILQGFKEVDSNFMQSEMSVRDLFNANMSLYTAEGDHTGDASASFSSMSLRSSCEDIDGVEDELEEELGDGGNGSTITTAATTASFLAAEFVFPMRAVGRSERGDGLGGGERTNTGRGAMLLWDVRSSIDGSTLGGDFHRKAF
jgi:hypothetical protein